MSERRMYEPYLFESQSFQTNVECVNPLQNPGDLLPTVDQWELPFSEQPKDNLSKSPRNMEIVLKLGEVVQVNE